MDDDTLRPARWSKNTRLGITLVVVLVLFVTGCLLLIHLLRDMDWDLVLQTSPGTLLVILALTALGTLVYACMIYVLVRASGYTTTLWRAYLVLTASMSANYVTPVRAGIPLRIYLYSHFMGIPAATGTTLVAVETLVGMLVPAFIACAGIAVLFPALGLLPPLALIALLLAGLLLALYVPLARLQALAERAPLSRLTVRLVRFVGRVQKGLRGLSPAVILGVVLLDLVMLGLHTIRLWLVLGILGPAPSPLTLFAVLTISLTAGNLSMIPMGLGVRDASLTLLLTQLGLSSEIALSAAVIQRLFSPGWPLLLGLISTNILGVSEVMRRSENGPALEETHDDQMA